MTNANDTQDANAFQHTPGQHTPGQRSPGQQSTANDISLGQAEGAAGSGGCCAGPSAKQTPWLFYGTVVGLVLFMAFVVWNRSPADLPRGLGGTESVGAAMAVSEGSGKPVLVFATADWCGPCQSFKRGPLADPDVVEAIESRTEFTVLDLTDRSDQETQRTAGMLGVRSIPAMVLIEDGAVVDRWNPRAPFPAWLERVTDSY